MSEDNYITIILNGNTYKIWSSELKKITYDKNKKIINFNRFLGFLSRLITNENDKIAAKQEIIDLINSEQFKTNSTFKFASEKNNFTLRVYQGSNKWDNVAINIDNSVHTVKTLVNNLLLQIPKTKRKIGSLRYSIKTFFAADKSESAKKKELADTKINIPFQEFDAVITSDTKDLKKLPDGSVNFNELIENFSRNFNLTTTDPVERKSIKENIKNVMQDYLTDNDHKSELVVKKWSKNDLKINVQTSDGKSFQAILEIKDYDRVEKFLNEIIEQIPKDKRNKTALLESIAQFTKVNDVVPEGKIIVPQELSLLAPTNTKDVVVVTPAAAAAANDKNVGMNIWTNPIYQHEFKEQIESNKKNNKIVDSSTIKNASTGLFIVYTDIIYPRTIGNTESRYLRIIPCADAKGGCIEFKNIEYVPLEKTYMESISIIIADGKGEKIQFNTSTKPTYIMLHFKIKEKSYK